jgi:hypothetical protein
VIAAGASQSAVRLTSYHNSIHPLTEVFVAFVIIGGGSLLRTDLAMDKLDARFKEGRLTALAVAIAQELHQ